LQVVHRGYQTRYGEIDLICRAPDKTWVFVEVKARSRSGPISAADAVTPAKQRKIIGAALNFLKKQRITDESVRFDVVLIEGTRLEWIQDAFQPTVAYTF
jgi:putative endonuclease